MSLTFHHVSFGYNEHLLISDLSCTFDVGTITVIKGCNGAGKTTLSKLCLGLCENYSGEIKVFDKNIKEIPLSDLAKDIYYCFQNPDKQLFCDSVEEEISFALKYRKLPMDTVPQVLHDFHLDHVKDQYPLSLSSGQKQRLAIACGLVLNPKFFVLDEPTSSLDRAHTDVLIKELKRLKEQGIGIIIISHDSYLTDHITDITYELKGGQLHEEA